MDLALDASTTLSFQRSGRRRPEHQAATEKNVEAAPMETAPEIRPKLLHQIHDSNRTEF